MIMKKENLRAISAQAIYQVLEQGQSLSSILPALQKNLDGKDSALVQEICFGIMRVLPQLEFFIRQLMDKVLTGKSRVLHYVIMVGLYQLLYTRIPAHAALSETVDAAMVLKKPQLKGLINGVLRQFQRQQPELMIQFEQTQEYYFHPSWLLKRLQSAYPEQWQDIINANNQRPPMWLRINQQYHSAEQYLTLLTEHGIEGKLHPELPEALQLVTPAAVSKLPGFDQGWATVQDLSAQYAARLLAPENSDHILDMCAAPGGKTTHILEVAPKAQILAVDVDSQRVKRITENLTRLKQQAEVKVGDGRYPEQWLDQHQQFDRILLDAPCSATGVIRRHPDIKWLRRDSDIAELVTLQAEILTNIWPYLKTGGILVYATCSVLPDENIRQIEQFLSVQKNAQLIGEPLQFLPALDSGDGFFYAKLTKNSA